MSIQARGLRAKVRDPPFIVSEKTAWADRVKREKGRESERERDASKKGGGGHRYGEVSEGRFQFIPLQHG